MSKLLCKLFGHKPPVYDREAYMGMGYGVVEIGSTDGLGRTHGRVEATCPRCQERYFVLRIHVPEIEDSARALELNKRVEVENYLLQCYEGKLPLPNAEVCRLLALRLGTPKSHWTEYHKRVPK